MTKKTYVFISILFIPFVLVYYVLFSSNFVSDADRSLIKVRSHDDIWGISEGLYRSGYIKSRYTFLLSSYILRYHKCIKSGAYRAGRYSSNWRFIKILKSGLQEPVSLVIHDVNNKGELIERVTKYLGMTREELLVTLDDKLFINSLGFTSESILSMFIPNTYELYWSISPKIFFRRMRKEYDRFWTAERMSQARGLNLSQVEVSILASIVQAETVKENEARRIAGVYLNRLRRRMRLEACPTLKYAIGNHSATRVLNEFKKVDSRYNTYKYYGLPPGPINIPRPLFIDSVLNAERHNYIYFCAKDDFSGGHYFSTNLNSHLCHARNYQRKLNSKKIYR